MGKRSRSLRHEKKLNERKAEKAAKKASYAALAVAHRLKNPNKTRRKKKTVTVRKHLIANCGNVGCEKCAPSLVAKKQEKW
jgi:hypothetical protein